MPSDGTRRSLRKHSEYEFRFWAHCGLASCLFSVVNKSVPRGASLPSRRPCLHRAASRLCLRPRLAAPCLQQWRPYQCLRRRRRLSLMCRSHSPLQLLRLHRRPARIRCGCGCCSFVLSAPRIDGASSSSSSSTSGRERLVHCFFRCISICSGPHRHPRRRDILVLISGGRVCECERCDGVATEPQLLFRFLRVCRCACCPRAVSCASEESRAPDASV